MHPKHEIKDEIKYSGCQTPHKKARPVRPTEACQIGRLELVFFCPWRFTSLSTVWLDGEMNCKGKDHWQPHFRDSYLGYEPVDGRDPRRQSLSLLKCIHPTFSDSIYHCDRWISLLEFFTLSLPQSLTLFSTWLLTKTITERPYCAEQVAFKPEWSYIPRDLWKCLETFLLVTAGWGAGQRGLLASGGQWAL